MSIYDINGMTLTKAYNNAGGVLAKVYTLSGQEIVMRSLLFSIMTYNVGQWYIGNTQPVPSHKKSEYYILQSSTIEDNPVDVMFVQEYLDIWCEDNSPASELIDLGFDNQEITNPTGYIGHSICTNGYDIKNYTSHNFSQNSGSYPTFETAVITVDGTDIYLINTHNDFRLAYQTINITDLLNTIASYNYFILCGDFNIDLDTVDTTGTQYQNSVQRFLDAGYHVGNCVIDWVPTYYATEYPTGGKFTDQIVTSPNIDIVSIRAFTEKLTDGIGDKIDHIPLIANLVIH